MSGRGKTICALLALGVLLLLGWLALRHFSAPEETPEPEEETLLYLENDLVLSLRLSSGGESLTLSRDNAGLQWEAEEFPGAALDEAKIASILEALSPLKVIRRLGKAGGDFGFDREELLITAGTGEEEVTLTLGEENASLDGGYLKTSGEEGIFLVPRALWEAARHPALYFLKPDAIPSLLSPDSFRVNKLILTYLPEGSEGVYSRDWRWFFDGEGEALRYAGNDEVDLLLNAVRKSSFREAAGFSEDETFFEKTGLSTPEVTFEAFWTGEGEKKSFTLLIGKSFAGEDGERLCYAMTGGSGLVATMEESVKDALLGASEESLFPHDVLPVDWDTVEAVEIAEGEETRRIDFSRENAENGEGEEDETLVFREGDLILDRESCEKAFDALSLLTAESTADDAPGGEAPVFTLTLFRNTDSFREMTLALLPYDPLYYRVRFDGRDFLLVGKSEADGAISLLTAALREEEN